jgi:hypothetical protein
MQVERMSKLLSLILLIACTIGLLATCRTDEKSGIKRKPYQERSSSVTVFSQHGDTLSYYPNATRVRAYDDYVRFMCEGRENTASGLYVITENP